ncbi:MAG: family 43 glycosylhydrolase [Actinophytocola sp.]|uniref:family 43 glycosylhydrolase n=1 Tax=Actinophytocola sp. TaxID=1872138 RepID=UPI003C721C7C
MPRTSLRATLSRALLAVVLVLSFAGVAAGDAGLAAGRPFANPVKAQKGADPWLEYYDGNYYLVTTSWTSVLTMRKSPTLAGLATAPGVQVWAGDQSSRCCNFWAPELHPANGRWYLYFSGGPAGTDYARDQRVHVLESAGADPMGPYAYKNKLYAPGNDVGLIDSSVLELNGQRYLLGSAWGSTQNLVIAPMSNPYTVSGALTTISTPTYSWERQDGTVNEGPEPLYHNGKTFIVYSASACWGPNYKLGLLTHNGGNPLSASSWTKAAQPVFQRNDGNSVYGPGHNGFFTSPDGTEDWLVYHANDASGDGCDNNRTTRAQKFTWNSDGTPNFGAPVRLGTTLDGPSGETAATPAAYTIVNRNSGKCLQVSGSADGAGTTQSACTGSSGQRWRFEDLADDTSRLVNAGSGKVLDVADCGTADGAVVRQWSWLNNTCQRFRPVVTAQDGWVRLTNLNSGKVLDVADCGTADGAVVRQWSWLNNTCQQWRLQPV